MSHLAGIVNLAVSSGIRSEGCQHPGALQCANDRHFATAFAGSADGLKIGFRWFETLATLDTSIMGCW